MITGISPVLGYYEAKINKKERYGVIEIEKDKERNSSESPLGSEFRFTNPKLVQVYHFSDLKKRLSNHTNSVNRLT